MFCSVEILWFVAVVVVKNRNVAAFVDASILQLWIVSKAVSL